MVLPPAVAAQKNLQHALLAGLYGWLGIWWWVRVDRLLGCLHCFAKGRQRDKDIFVHRVANYMMYSFSTWVLESAERNLWCLLPAGDFKANLLRRFWNMISIDFVMQLYLNPWKRRTWMKRRVYKSKPLLKHQGRRACNSFSMDLFWPSSFTRFKVSTPPVKEALLRVRDSNDIPSNLIGDKSTLLKSQNS